MSSKNNENKGSNSSKVQKGTEIRSTAVNPSSGPKPAPPAKQPK